jgi:threonylcarbamoyladenosine tRNA methylthiotransferase MtaB
MKVAIHTLGCKLNQAESELLARRFIEAGHGIVSGDEADIHVLNTCSVTHIADRKSRHLVRLWKKRNPDALIVATGCYAESAPEELERAGAGLVVGNVDKLQLLDFLDDNSLTSGRSQTVVAAADKASRVRSFVKIQDGCNGSCAYCIVPQLRGREQSLPANEIINEVKIRVGDGYKEVVFTGTKIGDYNHNGVNLKELVKKALADTDVERLHLSSLQPQDISPEFLALWQGNRLCRHFHLALQSGSDSVLRRMRRRYSLDDYRQAVSSIRNAIPNAAITTDIIVGFPGESGAEFEDSYLFCNEMDFADIHVFSYSARPGTLAARMPEQVRDKLKKERSQRMLDLAQSSARRFRKRFLGHELVVLWENEVEPDTDIYSGLSQNYIRAYIRRSEKLTNRFLRVVPSRLYKDGLWVEAKDED